MSKLPERRHGLKTRILPDGFVTIVDTANDQLHTLPPIGAIVWELCDGTRTDEQIATEAAAYAELRIDEKFVAEVEELIEKLSRCGLLQ